MHSLNDPVMARQSELPLPTMMRAARYHEIGGDFSIDQIPVPKPRSRDVLVKVESCGVVPNLRYVVESLASHPALIRPPLPAIYGLDPAGIVVAKGEQVHGIEIGQRVYVNPLRVCGGCKHCIGGDMMACQHAIFAGYFGRGSKSAEMFEDYPYGGLSEFMTAPQESLVNLPDNVSFDAGARWGYLGTGYSALRRAGAGMNTIVLVNGASGTLGIGAVLFALALGVPKILAVGRNATLLQRVKALAPDRIEIIAANEDTSIVDWARSLTSGEGADIVIDALPTGGSTKSFAAALAALAKGGRHVNVGGVYHDVSINFLDLMNKNQILIGSFWFTTAEGREMASLAASGTVDLSIFEHVEFTLEAINSALDSVKNLSGGFSNYVIRPSVSGSRT